MCECGGMMTLHTYLTAAQISQRAFARSVPVSASFLNEIVKEKKTPGLALALKICEATQGKVAVASLLKREAGQ